MNKINSGDGVGVATFDEKFSILPRRANRKRA